MSKHDRKIQCAPNPPEFAQPRLSRVKVRSSPARGSKFGCVCSYMASHRHPHDRPYRNKHTQICTPSLGTTAVWPYVNRAAQIRLGLEHTENIKKCPKPPTNTNFGHFSDIFCRPGCSIFCLQLEASCLQLSSFAYNVFWELFYLPLELFCLQLGLFCVQWKSVSKKNLKGL